MSKKTLVMLVLVAFWLVGCATTAPVLDSPRAIDVPGNASMEEIEDAILDAMRNRGWAVHERNRGEIIADLHVRSHFARVGITYNTGAIAIEYMDSENLEYEVVDGQQRIHGNFNSWLTNLSNDIQRNLSYVE
ncbi:hypothetical protein [Wenzhouxiangella sediminis]|jgi:hypothetical protein|uniref:Lipoprotein n=1 Tax=Wenzhouxiangella sediminis TaxID=1792836 RepID=A0A3E1KAF2_9GAMM|nr:hypothetical protein [Wenzhouxiangella sediminis]MEE4302562.1 hypothetical protein [Wenzhouxiangella sp.]RFF31351.1 hypothetical protein DZC52_04630 [Wenzhouxiangella sediminis]